MFDFEHLELDFEPRRPDPSLPRPLCRLFQWPERRRIPYIGRCGAVLGDPRGHVLDTVYPHRRDVGSELVYKADCYNGRGDVNLCLRLWVAIKIVG